MAGSQELKKLAQATFAHSTGAFFAAATSVQAKKIPELGHVRFQGNFALFRFRSSIDGMTKGRSLQVSGLIVYSSPSSPWCRALSRRRPDQHTFSESNHQEKGSPDDPTLRRTFPIGLWPYGSSGLKLLPRHSLQNRPKSSNNAISLQEQPRKPSTSPHSRSRDASACHQIRLRPCLSALYSAMATA